MKKVLDWATLLFLLLTPLFLLVLPADYFDTGQTICPSKRLFNIDCPGCGMTRASMHLIHFDFDSAVYYNALCFVVVPILAFFWIKWTIITAKSIGFDLTAMVSKRNA